MSPEIDELLYQIVHMDGILLNPIYNAKSFLRMKQFVENKKEFENVLYINTGGQPNIFV